MDMPDLLKGNEHAENAAFEDPLEGLHSEQKMPQQQKHLPDNLSPRFHRLGSIILNFGHVMKDFGKDAAILSLLLLKTLVETIAGLLGGSLLLAVLLLIGFGLLGGYKVIATLIKVFALTF